MALTGVALTGTEGAEAGDLKKIPQSNGRPDAEATGGEYSVDVNPQRVEELWKALAEKSSTPAIDKTDQAAMVERLRKQAMADWNNDAAPVAVDDDADVQLEIDGGEVIGGWVAARVYVGADEGLGEE